MKKFTISTILSILSLSFLIIGGNSFAATIYECRRGDQSAGSSFSSLDTCNSVCLTPGYQCVAVNNNTNNSSAGPTVQLDSPLPNNPSVQTFLGTIIKAVLGVVGSLALVMFIYGGLTMMVSGGNATTVTKGKDIMLWAAVGLIVVFSAYALVRFVIEKVAT